MTKLMEQARHLPTHDGIVEALQNPDARSVRIVKREDGKSTFLGSATRFSNGFTVRSGGSRKAVKKGLTADEAAKFLLDALAAMPTVYVSRTGEVEDETPRKRGRPRKNPEAAAPAAEAAVTEPAAEPRKRGRPRKTPVEATETAPPSEAPKKRGRAKATT